jgi:hypothetical protein
MIPMKPLEMISNPFDKFDMMADELIKNNPKKAESDIEKLFGNESAFSKVVPESIKNELKMS